MSRAARGAATRSGFANTGQEPPLTPSRARRTKIPRERENDYTPEAAAARRAFLREQTGVALEHVARYSFDPSILPGNVEHFTGVAQVPIGIAGPLLVDGEHAQGEFYVPLATTEGTLVASYNRGMKILHQAGGVKTTILDDAMQRAPAFVFDDARRARAFGDGSPNTSRRQAGRRGHHRHRSAARHRAVLRQPDPVHALRLHHGRRGRPEPHGQGDRRCLRLDHVQLRRASPTSTWSRTSRPTRRARRSTCCAPAASASSRRRRSRPR